MKLPKKYRDKYFAYLLMVIFAAAAFTLQYLLQMTTFGFDMARDAYHAYSISHNFDFKILGPGTDIPGLNHGVMWFYFLAIPYFIAQQDPQIAVLFFFVLSIMTIPFVWLLAERLFKDRGISLVAVILYSFSPLVVPFGSWMSNPILALYCAPPLLLLLWDMLDKPTVKKSLLVGLLLGIMIQVQLANLILLISIPLLLIVFRPRLNFRIVGAFFAGLIVVLSSYFLVEIKFGGRGVLALMNFLNGHESAGPNIRFINDKLVEFFQLTVFPFSSTVVSICILLFVVVLATRFKRNRRPVVFLLIWLVNLLIFTFFDTGISHSTFVFIPSIAALVILVSFAIRKFIANKYLLAGIVLILLFFQIKTVVAWQADDISHAAIQRSNTAKNYKKIIDYTYLAANGEPFTLNTVTIPLYINTTWAYLYEFYGYRKYGYLPYWGGRTQKDYQGNLEEKQFGPETRFLIIESTIGIPDAYVLKAQYEEDKVSDIVEEKRFGYVIVQKRKFSENKEEIPVPEMLRNSNVLYE